MPYVTSNSYWVWPVWRYEVLTIFSANFCVRILKCGFGQEKTHKNVKKTKTSLLLYNCTCIEHWSYSSIDISLTTPVVFIGQQELYEIRGGILPALFSYCGVYGIWIFRNVTPNAQSFIIKQQNLQSYTHCRKLSK
jgi:hypothetical protein